MAKLAALNPDNCLIIKNREKVGFQVVGRLLKTVESGRLYKSYTDRFVTWSNYFSHKKSNILQHLDETESETAISEVCDKGAIACFMEAAAETKAYALNKIEFNEIVPILGEGQYSLYIECENY